MKKSLGKTWRFKTMVFMLVLVQSVPQDLNRMLGDKWQALLNKNMNKKEKTKWMK